MAGSSASYAITATVLKPSILEAVQIIKICVKPKWYFTRSFFELFRMDATGAFDSARRRKLKTTERNAFRTLQEKRRGELSCTADVVGGALTRLLSEPPRRGRSNSGGKQQTLDSLQ
ncbi:hypothetical protein AAFF_G00349100 [Aldrovandia affinis]|uniref:Uncharacterized protein n=1 Tax=Aldrovandia affinis TaxID=143900 RepID=A0AAD7SJA0_9TELE|nr:hypothetical protein AAFF_G00349100 [Aldrovandia affinis]